MCAGVQFVRSGVSRGGTACLQLHEEVQRRSLDGVSEAIRVLLAGNGGQCSHPRVPDAEIMLAQSPRVGWLTALALAGT